MFLMMEDQYSSSSPSLPDVTFSPHNDPVGYPSNIPLKRMTVADLDHDDTQTLSTNMNQNAAILYSFASPTKLSTDAENNTRHSAF